MSDTSGMGEQEFEQSFGFGDEQQGGESEQTLAFPELSAFANSVLAQIPESDRPVVAKYYKTWDGEVTRKFQDLRGKLTPYEQLGDPRELASAREVYKALNEAPDAVFRQMVDYFRETQPDLLQEVLGVIQQQEQQKQQTPAAPDPLAGLPKEFVSQFDQVKQAVEFMAQNFIQQQEAAKVAEQDRLLDQMLADLHKKHGEFDEEYVLTKMMNGSDPESAVKAYIGLTQQAINSSRKPAPPILGGSGGVPGNRVDPAKMTSADAKNALASMLQATINANNS